MFAEPVLAAESNRFPTVPRWLAASAAFAAVLLGVGIVGVVLTYGSLSAAISRLQGYALAIESPSRSIGSIPAGERTHVSFDVQNIDSNEVTILGARTSCGCTTVSDLPVTLAPGEHSQLSVAITTNKSDVDKGIKATVLLYVDRPSRRLVLRVRADVRPASDENGVAAAEPG